MLIVQFRNPKIGKTSRPCVFSDLEDVDLFLRDNPGYEFNVAEAPFYERGTIDTPPCFTVVRPTKDDPYHDEKVEIF